MRRAVRVTVQLTALTSAGLGGWYAGKNFERAQHLKVEKDDGECFLPYLTTRSMPALPIFGTVSAASPIVPAERNSDMGAKLATTASRTAEVSSSIALRKIPFRNTIFTCKKKKKYLFKIMRFGFPGLDTVRSFDDFVLSYDRRNRVAHWVFEHLTKDKLQQNVDRSNCEFKPDESIHPFFR